MFKFVLVDRGRTCSLPSDNSYFDQVLQTGQTFYIK